MQFNQDLPVGLVPINPGYRNSADFLEEDDPVLGIGRLFIRFQERQGRMKGTVNIPDRVTIMNRDMEFILLKSKGIADSGAGQSLPHVFCQCPDVKPTVKHAKKYASVV